MHLCATLLPDRTVLVNGGSMMEESNADATFEERAKHVEELRGLLLAGASSPSGPIAWAAWIGVVAAFAVWLGGLSGTLLDRAAELPTLLHVADRRRQQRLAEPEQLGRAGERGDVLRGGLEWRATETIGIFGEGRYTWGEDDRNSSQARVGVRFVF